MKPRWWWKRRQNYGRQLVDSMLNNRGQLDEDIVDREVRRVLSSMRRKQQIEVWLYRIFGRLYGAYRFVKAYAKAIRPRRQTVAQELAKQAIYGDLDGKTLG